MSSCETSDAEGPVPVNSAAVLKKSQPAPASSPCRGHVLRKAKVSSRSSCLRGNASTDGEQASRGRWGTPALAQARCGEALQPQGWWVGCRSSVWPPVPVLQLLY